MSTIARNGGLTLKPIRPAAPIRDRYESRAGALLRKMHESVIDEITATYRANLPETVLQAMDETPVAALGRVLNRLGKRWLRRFDTLSEDLAGYFATAVKDRCDRALAADLRRAGFTVRFKMTGAMRDAYDAVRAENVGLIKSIPEQYLAGVEQLVMASVSTGRDLGYLSKELVKRYQVSRRRAARIAMDQSNKATAVLANARYLELGITQAKWLHSAGGVHPRPEHVAFAGKTYDIAKGHDFGNGEGVVWPGTAINCRCVAQPIVPGFDD